MRFLSIIVTLLTTQSMAANAAILTEALDPSHWKQDITSNIALNYFSPSITAAIEDFANNSNKTHTRKIEVASARNAAIDNALSILNSGKLNEPAKAYLAILQLALMTKR